ncbi:DUF3891 family protein [Halalkalibacter alkalisediminis]|uniref:DUF3891 family protein n=1 Tax=Halalkalibacter alkalisediminis TaxID=935616 RepID=A0ABV6NFQ2_9BACI|nr:DUF3891 family protein [Halalkalibacter alkalisediminis]
MIIREREHEYVFISQHDHANLSGKIARQFKGNFFQSDDFMKDAITAVYEHDRGWIKLDQAPIWNEQEKGPFSFAQYPLTPKLIHYKLGLEEVQDISKYAALLCSMHYCSFFSTAKDKKSKAFLRSEKKRQEQLREKIDGIDYKLLNQHFRLLQVCDDLSLYVCFNEPGTSKENEHPWFKEGFRKSELFNDGQHSLCSTWVDDETISVTGFPFVKEFEANLDYRVVSKVDIVTKGLEQAYLTSSVYKQRLRFVPAQ